jgi:hypothetical protein
MSISLVTKDDRQWGDRCRSMAVEHVVPASCIDEAAQPVCTLITSSFLMGIGQRQSASVTAWQRRDGQSSDQA